MNTKCRHRGSDSREFNSADSSANKHSSFSAAASENIGVADSNGNDNNNESVANMVAEPQCGIGLGNQTKQVDRMFDVETCRRIFVALQREGAELIGDGVRRPSGKRKRSLLRLCQIGDVLLSLNFKANRVEVKLNDSTPDRVQQFHALLSINGDSAACVKKLALDVLNRGKINPNWVKEVKGAYQSILNQLTSGNDPFLYKKFDWRGKQFDPPKECLDQVDALEKSLLFAMSHGSHELFHTNVWAWLIKRYHEFAHVFFADIDVGAIVDVKREQGNRDLTIWVNNNSKKKAYVVENKFKSSAREGQLVEYKKTLSGEFADGLLVTLDKLPDGFELPDGWSHRLQSEVVAAIMSSLGNGHYEKDAELKLIASYADVTSKMTNLFAAYRNELGERWALALNHSEWDEVKNGDLETISLADIFKKMNASDFKVYLEKKREWAVLCSRVKEVSDSFDLVVTTDFLHKLPVVNCNLTYKGSNDEESYIGVMLQGNSFGRVACSYAECWVKKGGHEKIYELLKDCWFDDKSFLRMGLSLMKRTAKKYKQYATEDYSFVYQDIGIEHDTFEYLAALVVDNMKTAVTLLEDGRIDAFWGIG